MSETPRQTVHQQSANLAALHRHLNQLASRVKKPGSGVKDSAPRLSGPTIVVRGK